MLTNMQILTKYEPVAEVTRVAQTALCKILTNRRLLSSEFCGTANRIRCSLTRPQVLQHTFILQTIQQLMHVY